MNSLQLEVGKVYLNRTGCVVMISSRDKGNEYYPFNDPYGASYTDEGFLWIGRESNEDLVEEYQPSVQPTKALTLEQIREMCSEANCGYCIEFEHYLKAVRDTERKHGIVE